MANRARILLLIAPAIILLGIFFVAPMFFMASFGFRSGSFGASREVFTLANFQQFLGNDIFHRLLWRTLLISFETSLLSVILAYPVAYFLAMGAGSRRFLFLTLLLAPAWTSFLLRVLAWKILLGSEGFFSSILQWAGLIQGAQPILLYSRPAVVVALVYSWVPFVALPIYAALQRIDRNLFEAATDLGCTSFETFLRVTLPLSLPGVIAGFFFVFIPTLGEWVTPALVGGTEGVMYGNIIQDQFMRALNWPVGSLMSFAMLLLALVFVVPLRRLTSYFSVEEI